MQVYIEDISEDYGAHGVTVYSLVHGMDAYVAEVRASGTSLFRSQDYRDGQPELDDSHDDYSKLTNALVAYINRQ